MRKPDKLEDVYVPIQRMYKSSRWFPDSPREGVSFVRPSTSVLRLHFREQTNQIWQVSTREVSLVPDRVFLCIDNIFVS